MKRGSLLAAIVLTCLAALAALAAVEPRPGVDWPSFRGIGASGVAEGYATPTRWNAETGEHVRWKVAIPGLAHSSPIVWGDLVCVTTAISERKDDPLKVGLYGDITPVEDRSRHEWRLYCLDKKTGAIRWQQTAHSGVPAIKRHPKSTHANATLATDGAHIVALFGSEGLHGYDMAGKLLWKKSFGVLDSGFFQVPEAQWGFASSPIIDDGLVIVQADVQTGSFLAAFDVKSGREVWRTPRSDVPTFGTPAVHVTGGRAQVVVNGWKHIGGYDLRTGKELWRLTGGGDIPVPTPIAGHGLIFITNAHGRAAPIYAIRPTATGDISLADGSRTNDHIVWSTERDGNYMQTPLVYGDYLYTCRDNGMMTVYQPRTGARVYRQRLGDGRTGFTASPVAADQKIYFTSEEGTIFVVKAGATFELLAENAMGEVCMATPAISEGVLFFRTRGHLVALGEGAGKR